MRISSLSTEYVWVTVTATSAGLPLNLSGDQVAYAFTAPSGQPVTWHDAAWVDTTARILIGSGAGGVVLAAGYWDVWLKVIDSPETVVRLIGQILVF